MLLANAARLRFHALPRVLTDSDGPYAADVPEALTAEAALEEGEDQKEGAWDVRMAEYITRGRININVRHVRAGADAQCGDRIL
jgi:hypothetical protein